MTTQRDPIFDPLVRKLTRESIKYAVGRKIFCGCGVVLDCRDAVVVNSATAAGVDCGTCFDKIVADAAAKMDLSTEATLQHFRDNGIEIDDGRVWFKK